MGKKKQTAGELLRFCMVGGLAIIVTFIICMLLGKPLSELLHNKVWGNSLANSIGYIISFVTINFPLTVKYTYKTNPTKRKFLGLVGAHTVNMVLQSLFLALFIWIGIPRGLAAWPAYTLAFLVNFTLIHYLFKHEAKKQEANDLDTAE